MGIELRLTGGQWVALLDGKPLDGPWDEVDSIDPHVGGDHWAFAAANQEGWYVYHSRSRPSDSDPPFMKHGPYENVHDVRLQPRLGDVAWVVQTDAESVVYLLGKQVSPPCQFVYEDTLQFSAYGFLLGYVGCANGQDFVGIVMSWLDAHCVLSTWPRIIPASFRMGPPITFLADRGGEIFFVQEAGCRVRTGPLRAESGGQAWILDTVENYCNLVLDGQVYRGLSLRKALRKIYGK